MATKSLLTKATYQAITDLAICSFFVEGFCSFEPQCLQEFPKALKSVWDHLYSLLQPYFEVGIANEFGW